LQIQQTVARRNDEHHVLRMHVAVADVRDVEKEVRRMTRFDWHVDDDGAAGRINAPDAHHAHQLGGHEQVRFVRRQKREDVRRLARAVRLFVRHELNLSLFLVGQIRPLVGAVGNPD
jgi:hypothetical protein